ncbi:hypothetical protein HN51_016059 [Arachis hypogaea]|uniref:BZIP domain-containing protein n=2 Tax=Arachis TaxID=3817 RepID=A0A445CQG0_ARAHY|nr:basic leucine zipper 10 isoform X1 [Arachis duranensis]XP_025605282.1 basic leucine zipper 10 isoform X1 [Arachis hypogaea]QHO46543.1 Transcription factor HBP-1a [Arachis hypogaea]RYR53144.1 hypothetical protein Ahy_A06g028128 [Arachis hypogaea]
METEKLCALSYSTSSSASEEHRVDRLIKTEIEAAETLADLANLAMREATASRSTHAPHFTRHSHSDLSSSAPLPGGEAIAGQQLDERSVACNSEQREGRQDDCARHMKMEQDADSLKTTSYSAVRCSKSRRNLTEEEKEARRIRRILANRESARQTIRRRQALCEDLTRKASNLVLENENLKKEKDLALKEYQSLETTNKHLKAQIAKTINSEVAKAPVEQESSMAEVTNLSGNAPWFVCNHFPVTQLFWPPIIQSSNPVQVQHPPFSSIPVPPTVSLPCSSETGSFHKQNNLANDNRTQNPLYMVQCPWLFPVPDFGNGQPAPPSIGLIDKRDELSLGKQCSSSLSLNTAATVDYQPDLPLKAKTVASGWTEAGSTHDTGHTTIMFPLNGAEQKTGSHIIGNFHGPSLDHNEHVSAVKQEQEHDLELQLHSVPKLSLSSTTSHTATSPQEKQQTKVLCSGKNVVDAVAAAEARKRRKELTRFKSIHNRQSGMHC